jgi:predicted nucleic acid-binding protein
MRYLLDTCVLSEFTKPKPEKRVMAWLSEQDLEALCVSAVTIGEIQRGISLLPSSNRRTTLEAWLNEQWVNQFSGRVLSLDTDTFLTWGGLMARLRQEGRTMGVFDSLIAATALQHRLTIVTRNTRDFQHAQTSLFDPWE